MNTPSIDIQDRSFWGHYWPALAWMGVAALAMFIMVSTIGDRDSGNDSIGFIVLIFGAIRTFWRGGRADTSGVQGAENKIFAWLFQWAMGAALWPLFEIYHQIRFLIRAGNFWRKNQVLVNENHQPIRAA